LLSTQFDVNPAQSAVNAMGSNSTPSVSSDGGSSIGKQTANSTVHVSPLDADRLSTAKTYWGNEVDSSNATTTGGIHVNPWSAIRSGTKLNFNAQLPQG
jgi:hypothetical protein